MPLIEFPSQDGKTILQANVVESLEGGCELLHCNTRPAGPVNRPKAEPKPKAKQKAKPKNDTKFSIAKASKFLRAWLGMMKQGAVSQEVYEYRRGLCEGVEGINEPCPHNRNEGGVHFCDSCGCGSRKYATLYVDGVEPGATERLWMPDPQCPIKAMRPMKGTGSLKVVGGRLKQMGKLLAAGRDEVRKNKVDKHQGLQFIADLEGDATDGN